MSLKLNLNQKQKLKVSNKMIKSLNILSMDSVTLRDIINQEISENPVIKLNEESENNYYSVNINYDSGKSNYEYSYPINYDSKESERVDVFEYSKITDNKLTSFLLSQLNMENLENDVKNICEIIIFSLDQHGKLKGTPETLSRDLNINFKLFKSALDILQTFEPAGVCVFNNKESLIIQAKRLNLDDNVLNILNLDDSLELIANNNIKKISELLKLEEKNIISSIKQIKKLNPYPANNFNYSETKYIIPDAYVDISDSKISIIIGNPIIPNIKIDNDLNHIMEKGDEETKKFLKTFFERANALINSLELRNKTFSLVLTEIVNIQIDYFTDYLSYLKPMTMREVADRLDINVSTVSRAIKNKYVFCNRGYILISSLFTSEIKIRNSKESVSNSEVKKCIKEIVSNESKEFPLSDQEITDELNNRGYNISRRTVSKYRLSLNIPSYKKRKKF